jgi:metal-sulfur cluster biosynthetic enzyme
MNLDMQRRVCDAIASVDDPCSIRANAPLSIFELGLVRDWSVSDDGDVYVVLSPTAPSCVLMGSIMDGVQRRVRAIEGVRSIEVEIDTNTFWTPAMMSDEGRAKLGARRAGSMNRVPVKPRQWKQAVIGR